ncbi:hypothetical protein NMG60_11024967 [Bertholletia excelsa]
MASSLISNPVMNSRESSKRRKKKKVVQAARDQAGVQTGALNGLAQWKSEAQQEVYSSKLVQALRQVRLGSCPTAPRRGRAVREAADRVLAATARGRTRWSRAILTSRLKLKFMKNKRQRVSATGNIRSRKPRVSIWRLKSKNLPAVQRKVRVLGRLVPGCRKEPLPVILEEATDYIPALEMQVRAMSTLVTLLSGSGSPQNQPSSSRPPPC